jgi:hypothetical protein
MMVVAASRTPQVTLRFSVSAIYQISPTQILRLLQLQSGFEITEFSVR